MMGGERGRNLLAMQIQAEHSAASSLYSFSSVSTFHLDITVCLYEVNDMVKLWMGRNCTYLHKLGKSVCFKKAIRLFLDICSV